LSVDRPTRFVVAWAGGPDPDALAGRIVPATRARTAGRAGVPRVGDGQPADEEAIRLAYRDRVPSGVRPGWDYLTPTPGVALTQAVKRRRGHRLERVDVRATIGSLVEQPDAVHLERLNGCLRDRLGCLTRKTHAFAKETATWDAAVSLAVFEHNWLRPHVALREPLPEPTDGRRYRRRTPAMAIGLADHAWALHESLTRPAYHRN
jgi:hypothetical protein